MSEKESKQELEQLASELAILQEIAIDLSSGLTLPKILQKAVSYAGRLTNADAGVISLCKKGTFREIHTFDLPAAYPLIESLESSPLLKRALVTRKPQICQDYLSEPWARDDLKELGLRSMMVVPLLSGSHILGFLELLQLDPKKKFSDEDLRDLEILIRHVATAVQNAESLKEIELEARFRKAVSHFSADINSSLELLTVLQKLCKRTVELFGLGGIYIWLVNRQKKQLEGAAAYGFEAEKFLNSMVPLTSSFTCAKAACSKKTLVVNELDTKKVKTFLSPGTAKSAMFVPLLFEGELLGVALLVDTEDPRKFDGTLVAKIETLAGQAVTAIRNAKLYEEMAKSRSFMSGIFRDFPAVAAVVSVPDYRVVETNKQIERMAGSTKKVLGKPVWRVLEGLPRLEIKSWLDQVAESGRPFMAKDVEILIPELDRTCWDFVLTPNLNPLDGNVETVTLMAVETTEEFRLRNALEEAMTAEHNRREELEAVISGMNAGVSIYDAKGHPVYFNEFVKRMFEDEEIGSRSAAEQLTLYDIRDARSGKQFSRGDVPHERALRERFSHVEVLTRTLEGQERVLSLSGAPLKDKSGEALGAVLVSHDITPLRRTQERLQSSLRTSEILLEASNTLASSLNLRRILDKLTSLIARVSSCSRVRMVLLEPESDEFVVVSLKGVRGLSLGTRSVISEQGEALRKAYQSGKTTIISISDRTLDKKTRKILASNEVISWLLVPVRSKKKILGFIYADTPGEEISLSATEIRLVESIAHQAAIAIEKASLYECESRRSKQLEALQRFVIRISKEKEPAKIVRLLGESARKLVNAGSSMVCLFVDGKWQNPYFSKARKYPYECKIKRGKAEMQMNGRLFSEMMETKKPIRLADVSGHPLSKGIPQGHVPLRGLLGVPLLDSLSRFVGHLMVSDKHDGSYFTQDDENLLVTLVRQASIALEKARAFEREHRVATVLQESLLTEPTAHPELEVSLLYRAATEAGKVGGDFYDFLDFGDELTAVVVGDIAGKGIQAATLTAMVKNFVRAYACEDCRPASVLSRANKAIYSQTRAPDFASLIFGVVDRRKGTFAYANAGHPWPMVLASRGNEVRIGPGVNLPLGVQLGERYREHLIKLRPGDRLVLYTDGVTEIRKRGRTWGEEGLQKALIKYGKLGCQELTSRILSEIREFSGGRIADDIIILVLRWIPRRSA